MTLQFICSYIPKKFKMYKTALLVKLKQILIHHKQCIIYKMIGFCCARRLVFYIFTHSTGNNDDADQIKFSFS